MLAHDDAGSGVTSLAPCGDGEPRFLDHNARDVGVAVGGSADVAPHCDRGGLNAAAAAGYCSNMSSDGGGDTAGTILAHGDAGSGVTSLALQGGVNPDLLTTTLATWACRLADRPTSCRIATAAGSARPLLLATARTRAATAEAARRARCSHTVMLAAAPHRSPCAAAVNPDP